MGKHLFQQLPADKKTDIRHKNKAFRRALTALEATIPDPAYGYFGPQSISWQIYREPVIVLGGMRAVLLQTAHPAVAQGVEDNSNFRNHLFARGRRTIQALYALIFGDVARARSMATKVYNIHHLVTGTVSTETGSPWAGQPYAANDPELLTWVAATVADTTINLYETLFGPFSPADQDRFMREYAIGATLNGIPSRYHFSTLAEMRQYISDTINGPDIAVGEIGYDIARLLFRNQYTPSAFDERFTIGLLPEEIRHLYRLPWNAADQRRHESLLRQMRFAVNTLPRSLRSVPAYHQAGCGSTKSAAIGHHASAEP